MKDNPCIRFSHIGVDGQLVYKPKKVFDTDKDKSSCKNQDVYTLCSKSE